MSYYRRHSRCWQFHTWRCCVVISRQLHIPSLLVPGGNEIRCVAEIFWFSLASDARFAHSEGFVSSYFMPHSSQSSVESRTGAAHPF
eukprot:1386155-Amphidinium_carterae.2